ncbi:MAG: hypothetical protein R3190_17975, partial [Thermoanaerobaculia bacterium]|nr:hypothetical protein [Thermoanaerobaculia bacterium]
MRAQAQRPELPRRRGGSTVTALLAVLALVPGAARPIDIGGSILLFQTATDNDGIESDLLEQRLNLDLSQRLTPYISLRFGYQYFDFSSESEVLDDFSRRSRRPRLEMLYSRRRFSALVATYQSRIDSNSGAETFETDSLLANLSWASDFGLSLAATYRDESNVLDRSLFGRETDSRFFTLDTSYGRKHWGLGYSYRNSVAENRSTNLRSDQERHDVRARASRDLLDDRLHLGLSGHVGTLTRTSRLDAGADAAEPIEPFQGLFAVDTSPEIGELDPAPTLVDGDVETPADPPIDIGGAATFRNLGLDLAVSRPVTRLEIWVDGSSSAGLLWEVYRSIDNLLWERVDSVVSEFDGELLRYTIRFPETVDRYLKAVNVSVNANPTVRVTEVRALVDVDAPSGSGTFESDLYRLDFGAQYQPLHWLSAALNLGVSNDEDVSDGFVRRDFNSQHAEGRIQIDLPADLRFDAGYRYGDTENLRA